MKAKEGIVLDRDGNPILQPKANGSTRWISTFSVGPWLGGVLIVFFIFTGITLAGTLAVLFVAVLLIRSLLSLFGLSSSKQR